MAGELPAVRGRSAPDTFAKQSERFEDLPQWGRGGVRGRKAAGALPAVGGRSAPAAFAKQSEPLEDLAFGERWGPEAREGPRDRHMPRIGCRPF